MWHQPIGPPKFTRHNPYFVEAYELLFNLFSFPTLATIVLYTAFLCTVYWLLLITVPSLYENSELALILFGPPCPPPPTPSLCS